MKHALSLSVLFLLLSSLFLSSCAYENEEQTGIYSCAHVSLDGEDFAVEDIYPNGIELELMSYGQAWLSINDEAVYGRWSLENEHFTLDIAGEISKGTLSEGVCTLELANSELEHIFLLPGAKLPEAETETSAEAALSDRQIFWNGDWYGVWHIENADGKWLDQSGQSFDCFARFDIGSDNRGTMLFWDELQSAGMPIAKVELIISDNADKSVSGVAVSTGGFFYDAAIEETQWSVEPELAVFDGMFCVENGRFESESGSFDYRIMLRPWGRTWEDVEAADPTLVPFFYYDWYLQKLASGEKMPDEFIAPEKTIIRNAWIETEEADI